MPFVDPAAQAYPATHGPLQLAFVSPLVAPNWPAGHGVQVPDAASAYWPGAHSTLVLVTDPAGQAYPAGHGPLQYGAVAPVVAP